MKANNLKKLKTVTRKASLNIRRSVLCFYSDEDDGYVKGRAYKPSLCYMKRIRTQGKV